MSKRIRGIIAAFLVVAGVTTNIHASRSSVAYANKRGKVKNVIMLIADGMSTEGITLARETKGSSLAMDEISVGSVITSWANGPITDSAPAGTALSSGYKTNPGVVGLNAEGAPQATILEAAELNGLSTGIIATSEITHATPAAFSAHIESRQDYNSIMKQQVYKDMEVVLGGGSLFFESTGGGKRNDGKDLTEDIKALGYDYVTTKSEMNESTSDKLWGLFASLAEGKSDEEIKELIKKYYGYTDITSEELEYAKNGQINEVMKISAKLGYTTGGHTGGDVYLGVYAPAGVEKLRGTVDNTELPKYIASNLGLNLDSASETLYQDIKCKIEADGATFTVNTDDSENPYFLIEKEGKTLKVIANSNIVEVSMDGEKIEDKKLSSVSILIGENAYGNADEIVEILNEEVSHLKTAIKF